MKLELEVSILKRDMEDKQRNLLNKGLESDEQHKNTLKELKKKQRDALEELEEKSRKEKQKLNQYWIDEMKVAKQQLQDQNESRLD